MSQRTLLVVALALIAGGIILGAGGQLLSGTTPAGQSQQGQFPAQPGQVPGGQARPGLPGSNGQEGPEGRQPSVRRPGVVPVPKPNPSAKPTASPSA